MPLRPTDIPRPGVARPGRATAQPSTVQLPRIVQPQAAATADVAQSTRRKASEVERLAAKRRAAGRENAAALDDQAAALNRTGESVSRGLSAVANAERQAADQLSFAQQQFSKTIGGIANTFELLERQRQEPKDRTFADRLGLERSKTYAAIEAEHLNSPREGAAYIQELDSKLETAGQEAYNRVVANLGYEPSTVAKAQIDSQGYDQRAGAARRTAVAANNARVRSLVSVSDANVLDIARTAGGSGDLSLAFQEADASVDALAEVLPADQLEARRQAARETVVQAVVLGHLERGEIDQARLITDDLTGFAGEKASVVHAAIVDAAKAEGVDPALLLAISRHETAGKFDPTIRPIDPRTGKPMKGAEGVSGLFQMNKNMSRHYLGIAVAADAPVAAQAQGGAKFTADHLRDLKRVLGTEPTPGEILLAQILGFGEAVEVITAEPDTKLTHVLSSTFIRNSGVKGQTTGDMIAWAQGTMQRNMEAVVNEGLIEGRDISAGEAGIPLDASIRLSAAVAAKEKQLRDEAEKQRKEFVKNFSPLKPRPERDPAGWVFKHGSDEVAQAYLVAEKVLADQEAEPAVKAKAWQRALDMSLEEQRALGLSEREAKLLPNDQAKTLVNKLQEAKGHDAARMFYEIRDLAGVHFDKIYGELSDQGLTSKFQILAWLDPIGNPAQVNAVAQVLNIDQKDLKADLGPDSSADVTALFEGVETDYGEFRQAFEFGPFGAGTKSVTAGIIEAAKDVALNRFRLTGDLGEAQRKARALLEDHIEVVSGSNLNAVVPRGTGLSASEIEDATAFMQTRAQIDLFEPVTIGVAEVESPGELGEQQAEFRLNRTRNTAANYGVWVTNERGNGLVLVIRVGGAFTVLRNENGDAYEIPFDRVPDLANQYRAALTLPGVQPELAGTLLGDQPQGDSQ